MALVSIDSPSSVSLGALFTVNVSADSAQDAGGFEFRLLFNPIVLRVEHVSLGDLLASTGRTAEPLGPLVDNRIGSVAFGGYSYGTRAGANRGGVLGSVTFRSIAQGTSLLTLRNPLLVDTRGSPTAVTPLDASVQVQPAVRPSSRVYLPLMTRR